MSSIAPTGSQPHQQMSDGSFAFTGPFPPGTQVFHTQNDRVLLYEGIQADARTFDLLPRALQLAQSQVWPRYKGYCTKLSELYSEGVTHREHNDVVSLQAKAENFANLSTQFYRAFTGLDDGLEGPLNDDDVRSLAETFIMCCEGLKECSESAEE